MARRARPLAFFGMPETNELLEFLIDKPLKIVLIVLLAVVANRVARKGMKRALRTLQSGAVQERLGSLRAATPDALLATTEHSLRAEQRIEALASRAALAGDRS